MICIGLMSGTSMDGIDAALLKTDGEGEIQELGQRSLSYEPAFKVLLKAAEWTLRRAEGNLALAETSFREGLQEYLEKELSLSEKAAEEKLKELSVYLGKLNKDLSLEAIIQQSTALHLSVVQRLLASKKLRPQDLEVVGYHGQTLFFNPLKKVSVIVGDGQYLADHLGVKVVNDFRSEDLGQGGQGAPFAPLYHQALARRDKKIPLAVLNCGGIANITLISNDDPLDLLGFDTGPGNGLIDRLVKQRTQGQESMDTDGHYGKAGKVDEALLKILGEKAVRQGGQNYFLKAPPKALDSGDLKLISELDKLSLEDACATLEAFTAESIVNSLTWVTKAIPKNWILAGGGWKNPVIRQALETRLKKKLGENICIQTADEAGWNSQALEAQIFAYLAVRRLAGKPLSFPGTTGVSRPVSGGRIYVP